MLRLRPYKPCDAEKILSWIGDECAFRKWSADRFDRYPLTARELNAHYDSFALSDCFFQMTAEDEDGVVGHLILRHPDGNKRLVRFGFVIVDNTKRGKGYGKEMIRLALKFAFEIMKAEKVTIGVFDNNPAALHCYLSSGFHDTGMREIYPILGENWNCIELEASPIAT